MYDIVPGFEFDDKADLERYDYWFLDATHSVPPWTPMFGWFWVNFCRHGMQYGAEKLSLPTVKGWDWRFKNGGGYLTLYTVKSQAEQEQREQCFRQAIRPLVENYDKVWGGFVTEILGHYDRLKQTNVNTADNIELLANFEDTIGVTRRMWEIHMYMMYGVYTAFILFENVCKDLLGIDDTKPQFQRLLRGFDNKAFQVDRELWQFARKADDMGLGSAFKGQAGNVIPVLEQSAAGKQWLGEFRAFLNEDGWRMQRMAEANLPTWIEDPTPAIANVQLYLNKGGKFNLDDERKKLAAERNEAEKQVLDRVPAAQRDWFKTMLALAQRASSFSEEHNHYLDLYTHSMIRRSCMAIGKKLAQAGTIGAAEDIMYLMPDEVRKVAIAPEFHNLHPIVNQRRDAWESWQKNENPPFIGKIDMMAAIGELVKAIAINAAGRVAPHGVEAFHQAVQKQIGILKEHSRRKQLTDHGTTPMTETASYMGWLPVENFRKGSLANAEPLAVAEFARLKDSNFGCYSCMTRCGQVHRVAQGNYAGAESEGPEYETIWALGAGLANSEIGAVVAADAKCDLLGLDTVSAGNALGFACELYERGILACSDTDGLELTWGNHAAFLQLLDQIGQREGLGRLLGEGVKRAAEQIGRGAERYAMHVKGMELPGYEPRALKGYALSYATSNIGGSHMYGRPRQELYSDPAKAVDRFAEIGKGQWIAQVQAQQAADETAIVCNFGNSGLTAELLGQLLVAATGRAELGDAAYRQRIGERILCLERAFNVREGFSRKDDTLPERMLTEPLQDAGKASTAQVVRHLDTMLDEYYDAVGYTRDGIPTETKMRELELSNT